MAAVTPRAVLPIIRQALAEDCAREDITSRAIIPPGLRLTACIVAKAPGIAAGLQIAALTFKTLDPSLRCRQLVRSGAAVRPGTPVLAVKGKARSIFAAERTALNFLMHLSGIATLTHAFVARARGTRARILDTRKTMPGLRALEKDAVASGGGVNHRRDLGEAVLIKTNHLRALGQGARGGGRGRRIALVQEAILRAKEGAPGHFVQIEVSNLSECRAALKAQPHAILLDNWPLAGIRRAVSLAKQSTPRVPRPAPLLEVSGGVTLKNVRSIAATGVDRISIGRLTHSAPALDFSLKVP